MNTLERKLLSYMNARYPILYLHTYEEARCIAAVKAATQRTGKNAEVIQTDGGYVSEEDFRGRHISLLLTDSTILDESHPNYRPDVILKYKALARSIHSPEENDLDLTIVIISPILHIPKELEKDITIIPVDYLTTEEIKQEILAFAQENEIIVSNAFLNTLAVALKGLSASEIQNILNLAVAMDGDLTQAALTLIFEQKQQMILKSGLLEMVPQHEDISDIGGLENLKAWLIRKGRIFEEIDAAKQFGVDIPKGVLITGVPGCGKSLTAKAVAKQFNLPLLRLDMGRLFGKYLGESEANMRKAIELVEATAPCILWVDELEKAFAGIGGSGAGGEVTTRLFGSFLTWMQEKTSPVFVVATANDVTKLPPELLRKGRFDEIFFVGLPARAERQKIFEIHIQKRRSSDLAQVDCGTLAEETEGYSGADIEGVVREAIEIAFTRETTLTTSLLSDVIQNTSALSEIMQDAIEAMEREYERCKFKNASSV